MTAFSDFPAPKDFPNYMHNTKMREYLTLYADRIGFKAYVKLNHELINCEQNDDYEGTGRWRLTVRDILRNCVFHDVFDGVMVCTGNYSKPLMPELKNQSIFKGLVLHSHEFKHANGFEGKRVVVVGIGNSGADIGVELSNVCKNVYLSTRDGSWIASRSGPMGQPFDTFLLRRSLYSMYKLLPYGLSCWALEKYLHIRFDHKLYALKPKHRVLSQHIVINDELPKKIMTGLAHIKPDIQEFTENGVIFRGETHETTCDAVIYATGYEISYPFISQTLLSVNKSDFNLYKHIFSPHLTHPQTLAFIGCIVPFGALAPVAELQSRYFALLMANKLQTPHKKQMLSDIKHRKAWVKKYFPDCEKFALHVHYVEYMEEMARIIGVKPKLFKYFFTDPKLWCHLYFGPCVPYQYRLNGPNKWSNAREAILTVNDRIKAPFKTRHE
ncbi:unnamed protein product [Oppiella nova]|uniref:Flavin-containing monooxygenase n=1 Tax=Oppiella nova TaxID=334625 RepID=A0A7R9M4V1_9ACAR|nr:unnamed protein product [Oppiella nova]CAG2170815.1 unnamed protein product [Oppiella nova]